MKFIIFLFFAAFSNCEFVPRNFDWTLVKPITQTKSYRDTFPHLFNDEFAGEDLKVFQARGGRIIGGEIANILEFSFQVFLHKALTSH